MAANTFTNKIFIIEILKLKIFSFIKVNSIKIQVNSNFQTLDLQKSLKNKKQKTIQLFKQVLEHQFTCHLKLFLESHTR